MDTIFQHQFYILLGLILGGFAITAWFLLDARKKIETIFGGNTKSADPQKDLIRRMTRVETKLEEIEPRLHLVEAISKISIQKTGFHRFNPFDDTGGDNSFILALLDRDNNGVLITALYMRDSMRIYAKKVEEGKTKQQLSEEEYRILEETTEKIVQGAA